MRRLHAPVVARPLAPAARSNRRAIRSRRGPLPAGSAAQLCLIADVLLLDSQHTLHMLIGQVPALLTGEELRSLEHVLDLAAIHVVVRQLVQLFLTEIVPFAIGGRVEEIDPNMSARGCAEFVVLHADVDTRLESGIDVIDSVGGKEEDAFVIFEHAEEDGNEFVSLQIMRAALLKEDIGFVQEENCVPFAGHLKYIGEREFNFV